MRPTVFVSRAGRRRCRRAPAGTTDKAPALSAGPLITVGLMWRRIKKAAVVLACASMVVAGLVAFAPPASRTPRQIFRPWGGRSRSAAKTAV